MNKESLTTEQDEGQEESTIVIGVHAYTFRGSDGRLGKKIEHAASLKIEDDIDDYPVKIIARGGFADQGIINIALPKHLERIEDGAFKGNSMSQVKIPPNVNHIGYLAFADNPLAKVIIPPSVKFIDEEAFADTTSYLTIVCQEGSYAEDYAYTGHLVIALDKKSFEELYQEGFRW